jgi:hypothetical protein
MTVDSVAGKGNVAGSKWQSTDPDLSQAMIMNHGDMSMPVAQIRNN